MNDNEWDQWHSLWSQYENPLPSIERRARRMRVKLLASNAVFWTLVAGEVWAGVGGLTGPNAHGKVAGAGILLFCALMSAGFVWAQRGAWRQVTRTPAEMLDWMVDRQRRATRLAQLVRWGGVGICAFTWGLVVWSSWGQADLASRWAGPLAVGVFTVWLTWRTVPQTARRTAALEAEVQKWRAQLEAGPG